MRKGVEYVVLQTYFDQETAMDYLDLVRSGANTTDMRTYLAGGDAVAITIRIPSNLRDSAKKEAELRGTTLSSLIRECLVDELSRAR